MVAPARATWQAIERDGGGFQNACHAHCATRACRWCGAVRPDARRRRRGGAGLPDRPRRGRALHGLRRGRRRPHPGRRRLHGAGGARLGERAPTIRSSISVAGARAVLETLATARCRPAPRRRARWAILRQARRRLDGARDAASPTPSSRRSGLARAGYRPPPPRAHPRHGETGAATLRATLHNLVRRAPDQRARRQIGGQLARVLGGRRGAAGAAVTEQHILDLEREAFLSLCGEPKTRERIQYMLTNNKPLRN